MGVFPYNKIKMKKHYHIIGCGSGWGAKIRGCEDGPDDLVVGGVFERLRKLGVLIDVEMIYPEKRARDVEIPLPLSLPLVKEFNLKLLHEVRQALKKGEFPIVIGGDHSMAVGTWNAFEEPYGLLWLDAHMDSHTPETTPSGAYHGMPLAALLGFGAEEMTRSMRPKSLLSPKNVALIGVRSFEEEESALLQRLGVRVYFIEEVRERGVSQIFPEAIDHVTRGVARYGVSLDLDMFSPEDAPGVGSPVLLGVKAREALSLFSLFRKDPRWMGLEIMEFNPHLDVDHKTRELVFEILKEVLDR